MPEEEVALQCLRWPMPEEEVANALTIGTSCTLEESRLEKKQGGASI